MSGTISTARLERSLKGLTIGVVKNKQARDDDIASMGAGETEQQARLKISGTVGGDVVWDKRFVPFDVKFIPAQDRRDSLYEDPHMTYGSRLTSTKPVVITCVVGSYRVGDDGEIDGAWIWVGASSGTSSIVKFAGEAHLTFQGYAYTDISDDAG